MIQVTAGYYLSRRLGEVRARDYFTIPDYFSLSLLDELIYFVYPLLIICKAYPFAFLFNTKFPEAISFREFFLLLFFVTRRRNDYYGAATGFPALTRSPGISRSSGCAALSGESGCAGCTR
jgi:hypothetical protein